MNLQNKTILITGSSRGIGAATAKLAKKYGAEVILHGKTESDELKSLASELGCKYIYCDVSDKKSISDKIKNIAEVDVLINNAGISISKTLLEMDEEEWIETMRTNLLGVVNFSKLLIPKMSKQNSKIINISSIKGLTNSAGRPAFASSKAAIIALTSSMAKELAPRILVNAVAPGFTETETTKLEWKDRIYSQIESSLLKRAAKPEEIAEVILFLASDKSNYITGQTIIVDGGYTISGK